MAERLWKAYFENRVKGKVTDAGRIMKIKEAFFHGQYCGSDMLLKAMKLPTTQQMETFVQGYREQIQAGIKGQGHIAGELRLVDKPRIIPATRMPDVNDN